MNGKRWRKLENEILVKYYNGSKRGGWKLVQEKLEIYGFKRSRKAILARAVLLKVTHKSNKAGGPRKAGRPLGSIAIHSFKKYRKKRIKTAKGWKCYARHLLRGAGIEVPAGHCISYKDNDPLNCTLENIEIITFSERAKASRQSFVDRQAELNKKGASAALAAGYVPLEVKLKQYTTIIWTKKAPD